MSIYFLINLVLTDTGSETQDSLSFKQITDNNNFTKLNANQYEDNLNLIKNSQITSKQACIAPRIPSPIDGSCICDFNLHYVLEGTDCVQKTDIPCGIGQLDDVTTGACKCNGTGHFIASPLNPGTCICDSANNFVPSADNPGICVCDASKNFVAGTGLTFGQCVCDSYNFFVADGAGKCICDASKHFINVDGQCECDSANHYVFGQGSAARTCVCDTSKFYLPDSKGVCVCNAANKFISSNGVCICDASQRMYLLGQSCVTCPKGKVVNSTFTGCWCDSGTYDLSSSCMSCSSVMISNIQRTACINPTTCSLLDLTGRNCMSACPAGQISSGTGAQKRCICDVSLGYVRPDAATACTKCSGNNVPSLDGKSCTPCGKTGQMANALNSLCICNAAINFISISGSDECQCDDSRGFALNGGQVCVNCWDQIPQKIVDNQMCEECQNIASFGSDSEFDPVQHTCVCKSGFTLREKCLPCARPELNITAMCTCDPGFVFVDKTQTACTKVANCRTKNVSTYTNINETYCVDDCGAGAIKSSDGTINKCVCDAANGFEFDSGTKTCICKVSLGFKPAPVNGVCVCDDARGFNQTAVNILTCHCNTDSGFELTAIPGTYNAKPSVVCNCDILRYLITDSAYTCKCASADFTEQATALFKTCKCTNTAYFPSINGLSCVADCAANLGVFNPALNRCTECNKVYPNTVFNTNNLKCKCQQFYAGDPTEACTDCSAFGQFVSLDGYACVKDCGVNFAIVDQATKQCKFCELYDSKSIFNQTQNKCVCRSDLGYTGNLYSVGGSCTICSSPNMLTSDGLQCIPNCQSANLVQITDRLCEDCKQIDVNSEYKNSQCVCSDGYQKLKPTDKCTLKDSATKCSSANFMKPNADNTGCVCINQNFEMIQGVCMCTIGYYYNITLSACAKCTQYLQVPNLARNACVQTNNCSENGVVQAFLTINQTACVDGTLCGVGTLADKSSIYKCICDSENGFYNQDNVCICDLYKGYLAKPVNGICKGNMALGFSYLDNTTTANPICNITRGFNVAPSGTGAETSPMVCKCNQNLGFVAQSTASTCFCDTEKGFVKESFNFQCQCDTTLGFKAKLGLGTAAQPFRCECDTSKGFIASGNKCICDVSKGFKVTPLASNNQCVCDDAQYLEALSANSYLCQCKSTFIDVKIAGSTLSICVCPVGEFITLTRDKCSKICPGNAQIGSMCQPCEQVFINTITKYGMQCVCADNFVMTNGSCTFKTPILTCSDKNNLRVSDDGTKCECKANTFEWVDSSTKLACQCKLGQYLTVVGACQSCQGGMIPNAARNGCVLPSVCLLGILGDRCVAACGTGQIRSGNKCICDASIGYVFQISTCVFCSGASFVNGTQCSPCVGLGRITDDKHTQCICDASNGFIISFDNCKCSNSRPFISITGLQCLENCSEPNSIQYGFNCKCDNAKGFNLSTSGVCVCKDQYFLGLTKYPQVTGQQPNVCLPQCEIGSMEYLATPLVCKCLANSQYNFDGRQCVCDPNTVPDPEYGYLCKVPYCDSSIFQTPNLDQTKCVCMTDMYIQGGIYLPEELRTICTCKMGMYWNINACKFCPAGEYPDAARQKCLSACPAGTALDITYTNCVVECGEGMIPFSVGGGFVCVCDEKKGYVYLNTSYCVRCSETQIPEASVGTITITIPFTSPVTFQGRKNCIECMTAGIPIGNAPDTDRKQCVCDPAKNFVGADPANCKCDFEQNYAGVSSCTKCVSPTPYMINADNSTCVACNEKVGYEPNRNATGKCQCANPLLYSDKAETGCFACDEMMGFSKDFVGGKCVCSNTQQFLNNLSTKCVDCNQQLFFLPDFVAGKCICDETHSLDMIKPECVATCGPLQISIERICVCSENSKWVDTQCVCNSGYIVSGNICKLKPSMIPIIAGGAAGGVVVIICLSIVIVICSRKRRQKKRREFNKKRKQNATTLIETDIVDIQRFDQEAVDQMKLNSTADETTLFQQLPKPDRGVKKLDSLKKKVELKDMKHLKPLNKVELSQEEKEFKDKRRDLGFKQLESNQSSCLDNDTIEEDKANQQNTDQDEIIDL
ncbi:Conserved_hypothetical protein [Hexamita inflata]|uniref:EGF-like domain-containing protein n=1 Tax=Hexamita inflata TaxID=28002 RepID=A0AA86UHF3_9EUKA|nr:Conserved hypothetical protein [Hexamita inflata]